MGSEDEERRKKKRRSRSESPSDSSDDSRERKKHKKHKKEKHKKDKHKKSDKDKDKDKEKELLKQAKAFLKAQLKAGGDVGKGSGSMAPPPPRDPPAGVKPPGVPAISSEHYFEKSQEFQSWLLEYKSVMFNELSSERSHELFDSFVGAWNDGRLPAKYYGGLVKAPVKRTSHQWGFGGGGSRPGGMSAYLEDEKERQGASRAAVQADRKAWRAEQKDLMEELLPKATGGREARVEARIARREERKARDASPDMPPGRMDVLGGGGDDSFAAAKAREASRQQRRGHASVARREELAGKLAAAAAAEDAKMAQFRALLQSQAGPIQIAKRQ